MPSGSISLDSRHVEERPVTTVYLISERSYAAFSKTSSAEVTGHHRFPNTLKSIFREYYFHNLGSKGIRKIQCKGKRAEKYFAVVKIFSGVYQHLYLHIVNFQLKR